LFTDDDLAAVIAALRIRQDEEIADTDLVIAPQETQ
jgi:hypothetical protein